MSYTWSNLVIDGSPFTPAVGTITYTVTGTDINGCTATDLVDVTVNAGPTVAAGADQTVCFGTSVTLTATGTAVSYAWNNSVVDGAAFTPAVGSVSYTVTGTAANTCTTTDVVVVNVNPMPVAVATVSVITLTATTTGVTYQWVNCPANTVIVGATASTYTATANGDYAVITTNPSGCIDTSACVTVSQVGLEEVFGNSSVSIAPNPTTNEFTITMSNVAENTTVTVFDAAGKMIHVYDNVTSTTKVDLTAVQTGIYMIEVRNANGNKMYRVAKN